jgi:hypothetical protein
MLVAVSEFSGGVESLDRQAGSISSDYSWLLSSDFDVGAMDTALNDSLHVWATTNTMNLPVPDLHFDFDTTPNPSCEADNVQSGRVIVTEASFVEPELDDIAWHSHLPRRPIPPRASLVPSRAVSTGPEGVPQVDERYSATLTDHLIYKHEETRLSVSYINECLKLYWIHFHPIFPVIHFPSFRPTSQNALLILSMCSIGSLFLGGTASITNGHNIYTRLNKAILVSWKSRLSGTSQEALSVVQAALIGQTFGLLSGQSEDLFMTDMFLGTLIAWARQLGCFADLRHETPPLGLDGQGQSRAWKRWVYTEQLHRLQLALCIHDAELSSLMHHDPTLRHLSVSHNPNEDGSLFSARSAQQWYAQINSRQAQETQTTTFHLKSWISMPSGSIDLLHKRTKMRSGDICPLGRAIRNSQFTAYSILENIHAGILEFRNLGELDTSCEDSFIQALIQWRHTFASTLKADNDNDVHSLRALWHTCCMTLSTDVNKLEQALGRDGAASATQAAQYVKQWATSIDAFRCLVHALSLRRSVEAMRLNATPAIHIPRSLFNAGIAWICHRHWSSYFEGSVLPEVGQWEQHRTRLPEISMGQWISKHDVADISRLSRTGSDSFNMSSIYAYIELLQRLNRWGISQTFAEVLQKTVAKKGHAR